MREKWTDERLDDLTDRMGSGFARVDADLREVRSEVKGLRSDVRGEFAAVRAEMAANHRIMLQLSVGTIGTTALGFFGLIVTQL